MQRLAVWLVACVALVGASSLPFFEWIDKASVLEELQPSLDELDTVSFLQGIVDPRAMASSMGCDGSFECSDYADATQVAPEPPAPTEFYRPAVQPRKVTFPVGVVPRAAKCFLECTYSQSYEFVVGEFVPADSSSSTFQPPAHATRAHASRAHAAASSFLETESKAEPADAIPVSNIGSPFHCKTKCDFPQPLFCNPTRRMIMGSAGFTPQEHPCCGTCEAQCRSKTVVERFRTCFLGCRAFCPFTS